MITTYLQGGLGNQMFQLAVAYNHAKKHGDVSVFDLNNSHTPHQGENSSNYKKTLFKYFNHLDGVYDKCVNVYVEGGHSFSEIPYQENQQLQGFYQSEKYFLENSLDIKKMFIEGLMEGYTDKWVGIRQHIDDLRFLLNKPIVSIHVRRGDYLKFPGIHDVCPISYYEQSMNIIKDIVGDFHPYFVSDDIGWCRETFNGLGASFSNYSDEIDDMILMSNCDHNIIANSSFSWWSSYLNNQQNNIVVAPKQWFGPRGPQDQDDIIPKNWIKI
jgi:hypothetical protein